jgi:hypothetical protein
VGKSLWSPTPHPLRLFNLGLTLVLASMGYPGPTCLDLASVMGSVLHYFLLGSNPSKKIFFEKGSCYIAQAGLEFMSAGITGMHQCTWLTTVIFIRSNFSIIHRESNLRPRATI